MEGEGELSKCGDGYLTRAAVCVKGKKVREVGSGGGNRLSIYEKNILVNKYYSNGTQLNDNTSKW